MISKYKIYTLVVSAFVSMLITSCADENVFEYEGPAITHFVNENINFIVTPSDSDTTLYVGTTTGAAAEVELSIDPSSTAVEGVHFEAFPKTVTIASGEYVKGFQLRPIVDALDGSYTLILNISNSTVADTVSFKQTLTIELSRFCPLVLEEWVDLPFSCNEPGYGDYDVSFSLGEAENTIVSNNFWDYGGNTIYTLSPSDGPAGAIVTIEEQIVVMGGVNYGVRGSGTYEHCSRTMVVNYQVFRPSDGALYDDNTHTFTLK